MGYKNAEMLPGFSEYRPPRSALEHAAQKQLENMRNGGLLTDDTLILEQLVLDLSRVIGESCERGKAAAAALAARQLLDALEALPSAGDSSMQKLLADLNAL